MASTKTVFAPVSGMHCASCAKNIERVLKKTSGVADVSVNYATEKASVTYDPDVVTPAAIEAAVAKIGYAVSLPEDSVPQTANVPSASGEHAHIHREAPVGEHDIVGFVFPIALTVFAAMLWEMAATVFPWMPPVPLPDAMMRLVLFLLASVVMATAGIPFLGAVVRFFSTGMANMDTLVGIGTGAAYLYSAIMYLFPAFATRIGLPETVYFDVSIVVIGFIKYGKHLEATSKRKTGEALEKLMGLQAKTALVKRDGMDVEVPLASVVVGDIFIVKPGSKVPVDGIVLSGFSSIDESLVTGESMPEDKTKGDMVVGGTMNIQGVLTCRATKVGKDTLLSQIVAMVESAQGSKAPIERLADSISAVFVPTVMGISVIAILVWFAVGTRFLPVADIVPLAISSFIGILVIACPCALGLATPTAVIVAVGRGARSGILIKDAESLEKLHAVTTVVMDKTGTLTTGIPVVTDIVPSEGVTEDQLVGILAALEKNSEHPLARAVMAKARTMGLDVPAVTSFVAIQGKGVEGKVASVRYHAGNEALMREAGVLVDRTAMHPYTSAGKTPMFVARAKKLLGVVYVADTIKESAPSVIAELKRMGVRVVMLTGDNAETARYIANLAGVDAVIPNVLPNQKADEVSAIRAKGGVVAMVGDGVNDAPALATADVGIAMSTGTDVAISTANATLLHGDIAKLALAIRLSKRTMAVIRQNLFWAFAYNVVGIPVAAGVLYPFTGTMLSPVFAGLAMALSSVSVVTNSLRLSRMRI